MAVNLAAQDLRVLYVGDSYEQCRVCPYKLVIVVVAKYLVMFTGDSLSPCSPATRRF